MTKLPTPAEYWTMLAHFDWYYAYSDDHSVWSNGIKREAELVNIAKLGGPDYLELWDGWRKHMFTGKPWGDEQAPYPAKPEHE